MTTLWEELSTGGAGEVEVDEEEEEPVVVAV